jgi:hypothetical protein
MVEELIWLFSLASVYPVTDGSSGRRSAARPASSAPSAVAEESGIGWFVLIERVLATPVR